MTIYEEAPKNGTAASLVSTATTHPVAGLPNDNPSRSYWLQEPSKLLLGHRTTPDLPAEVDVVVVGSGITGAFAADALLEDVGGAASATRTVLVLEAREACFGATGRNGGHCQPMVYSSASDVSDFELATFRFLQRFVAEHHIPCDWRTLAGGVHAYLDKDLFELAEALVATLRAKRPDLADQITVVTADDVRNAAANTALDDLRLRGAAGALVQRNAASVWPYKLVAWVLERLVQRHAASGAFNLQTNTPVLHVAHDPQMPSSSASPWVVRTPRGTVRARAVLLATNGYASRLLPRSLADLVVPVRAQVAALVPPDSDTKTETTQTTESAPAGVTSSSTSTSSSSANGASRASVTVVETKDGQTTTTTTTTTTSNAPADRLTYSYVFVGHDHGQTPSGNRDEYLVQRPFTSGTSGRATATSSNGTAFASAFSSSSSSSSSSGGHFIWGGGRQRASNAGVGEWRDDEVESPVAGYLRSHLAPVLAVGGDNSRGEPPAQLEADFEWTGIMGFSRDANPWVGHVPSSESGGDGLYLAAGFSGHGMPSTSLCGRAVAGMIKRHLGWTTSSSSDSHAASGGDDNTHRDKVVVSLPLSDGGHAELPRCFLLTPERILEARRTCQPVKEADARGFLAELQHLLAARRAEP
ncbi:hypothetical protein SPBR_05734 [Sporothrix brasiliensis 5110]|uniref:FAD dependent oxidoreductase domain-containing protein n=1 Tax=Sporothrix brasiliensis 5110 TaxID=1398154 RepID=A0A0C2F6F5_9PEZI|nr:uncharacterized protein SPBR_05734 [Sporothrix brasiliensis 5110]KIH94529.1 hypothetical protein SPBR_05734 [Sporothrix brasiliensis 5110]